MGGCLAEEYCQSADFCGTLVKRLMFVKTFQKQLGFWNYSVFIDTLQSIYQTTQMV